MNTERRYWAIALHLPNRRHHVWISADPMPGRDALRKAYRHAAMREELSEDELVGLEKKYGSAYVIDVALSSLAPIEAHEII